MATAVRRIEPQDQERWHKLFDDYTRFYEREPSKTITNHLWKRIMDPACPVHAVVALDISDQVIGIANYVIHENTSLLTPVCYLQDLFVDPGLRAHGVGAKLIDWLISEMKTQKWSRLYWNTKENNYRARALYDKYTAHSGFLKYNIVNS